jgi:cell wall-associated NlpC family hydrolase
MEGGLNMRISSKRLLAGLIVGGLIFTPLAVESAQARKPYPTAQEVENARKNVAKKKAMINRLQGIIQGLTREQLALEKIAMLKAEKYNQAKDEEDAVAAKVSALQKKVDAATAEAKQAKTQLGQIASQMWRNGAAGTSLNLFLNSKKAGNLLYQLGAQEKIAQSSDQIYKQAVQRQQYAKSLEDELKAAKIELAAKTKIAEDALQVAQDAADKLQAKVDEQQALNRTFIAQLARLENISETLEQARIQGLIDEARQACPPTCSIDDAPELYDVGPPDTDKVDIAFSFAKKQLGERYVLGGMGPNVWDCSGITKASYAAAGIYIGTHSATNQFRNMWSKRRLIPIKDAVAGDLMWYSYLDDFDGDKYHVVMYLGDGMMLEAPNPLRTVRIVPLRYGDLFRYAGRPTP